MQLDAVERVALAKAVTEMEAAQRLYRQVIHDVIVRHGGDPRLQQLVGVDLKTGAAELSPVPIEKRNDVPVAADCS